jgi:tetratricopeptide (TPR) repeat protein
VAKTKRLQQWDRHPHAGWLLRTEGEAHQVRGDHAAARELFQAAYDAFQLHGQPAGRAVALKKLASAEAELGNTPEAVRLLDDALEAAAALKGERYLRAVILLARVHTGLAVPGPELTCLLDKARDLLEDASGAPTELGRVLVRRTQAGYRADRPTTLAAFADELGRAVNGAS